MATRKISQMPDASELVGNELIEVVQGGQNKKVTTADVAGLAERISSLGGLGDVSLQSPQLGDSLVYDGIRWRDKKLTATDVEADPEGAAAAAVEAHEQKPDPHNQYARKNQNLADLEDAEIARANLDVLSSGQTASVISGAIDAHEQEADPHPQYETKSQLQTIIRDALRDAAEAASGGRVTVLYDSHGNPNWMHVLPRFSYEDLGFATEMGSGTCTAFIVDGVEKSEIFIGQYLASGNQAQSIAGADPRASITYDNALAACAAKGQGWHLMTVHEWAAVALWCMANGFEPRGNTNWGRAHDATHETAVREDGRAPGDATGTGSTMAGGGQAGWYHTNDHSGIADLVGNMREWQHGLKFVNGRIVCLPDNDFAAPEASWDEQDVYVSDESGAPTLMNSPGISTEDSINRTWVSLAKAAGYTSSQLLRRLLIEPAGIHPQGRFYIRTAGERFPIRGGDWHIGSGAGLAALSAANPRSSASSSIGFRPAFIG